MEPDQIQFWREDVAFLAEQLRLHHANLYHTVSRWQFEEAVADLHDLIPGLSPDAVKVEMLRIVAMIGDGHTSFWLPTNDSLHFKRYPLRFYSFSDGIFVTETDADHQAYLGACLKSIAQHSTDEIISRFQTVVSGDNDWMRQAVACASINIPEILHALNRISDINAPAFYLETTNGETVTLNPPALQPDAIHWLDLANNDIPTALWRKHPERNYWFEYLEADKLLYLHHRVVRDADDESIAAFCERVFAFVESHPVERFVIDLRANGGGNNMLNQALVHGLICCKKVNQVGKLFTVIGRKTFSAAMNLAVDLERNTNTLFVGEPTGASPNHYGETFPVTLPHSGIGLTLSCLYWQSSFPADKRPWIEPEIPAPMSSTDYRANHDPVMAAILAYRKSD